MRVYVDSDVLIWHLRGDKRAKNLLRTLASSDDMELWMGAPQRAEVVFFLKPGEEAHTGALLSRFKTQPLTQSIVDKAAILYRKWHPSHGIETNDAFLAAMAIETGGRVYTLNTKHYPMPGLDIAKGW